MAKVGVSTIMMRVYFSAYHLWAANHFAQLTAAIEGKHEGRSRFDIEHRTYATNAILSSVAFMEAAVNELFQDAADNHQSYIEPLSSEVRAAMATLWKVTEERNRSPFSILEKYQVALTCAQKDAFPEGELPYQDANLLVKLRNELVHYKPHTLGGSEIHNLEKKLSNKFTPNALMDGAGNPFFPDKCLGHGCALWTVNASRNFADSFFTKLNVVPNYQRVSFS